VAFQEQAKSYPVGSVIVKEKLMSSYYDSSTKITTKESGGVGGMIKRYPGFNTLSGDWEYFYFEDKSKIVCGKIASCVNCHDSAIDDCVFGTWKNAPKRPETTFPDR
jgi:hypothetical protein